MQVSIEISNDDHFFSDYNSSDEKSVREEGLRTTPSLLEAMMGDWED